MFVIGHLVSLLCIHQLGPQTLRLALRLDSLGSQALVITRQLGRRSLRPFQFVVTGISIITAYY